MADTKCKHSYITCSFSSALELWPTLSCSFSSFTFFPFPMLRPISQCEVHAVNSYLMLPLYWCLSSVQWVEWHLLLSDLFRSSPRGPNKGQISQLLCLPCNLLCLTFDVQRTHPGECLIPVQGEWSWWETHLRLSTQLQQEGTGWRLELETMCWCEKMKTADVDQEEEGC